MLVACAGRSQAEIRLGLALARPAASWGLQLAVGKMETLAIARDAVEKGSIEPGKTQLLWRAALLTLLCCGSLAAQRPDQGLRRACGWRWLPRLCCGSTSRCFSDLLGVAAARLGLFLTCSSPSGASISR